MRQMINAPARVARGAAWLDEVAPGWERKLDFGKMEMRECSRCVLGQVFSDMVGQLLPGSKHVALDGFDVATCLPESAGRHFASLGFDLMTPVPTEWEELHAAWQTLVKDRFDRGDLSG